MDLLQVNCPGLAEQTDKKQGLVLFQALALYLIAQAATKKVATYSVN
jgi:hypothetical protein